LCGRNCTKLCVRLVDRHHGMGCESHFFVVIQIAGELGELLEDFAIAGGDDFELFVKVIIVKVGEAECRVLGEVCH